MIWTDWQKFGCRHCGQYKTGYACTCDKFDPEKVKHGDAFITKWENSSHPQVYRFVSWWYGEPVFQTWMQDKDIGGRVERFGLFDTSGLIRWPKHDVDFEQFELDENGRDLSLTKC